MGIEQNGRISPNGVSERTRIPNPTLEEISARWEKFERDLIAHIWSLPRDLSELGTARKSKTLTSKPQPVTTY